MNIHLYCSDALYLSFCCYCVFFLIKSYQNPANHKIWGKIIEQESALISGCIFSFFLMISWLDSIHLQYHNTSLTLLDYILSPLNQIHEYSYSKPCAVFAFIPKIIRQDQVYQQFLPHLNYLPTAWHSNQDAYRWMFKVFFACTIYYIFVFIVIKICLRKQWQGLSNASRTVVKTILSMMWLCSLFYVLSRQLHIFGTGQIGQDIFYYAIKSIRTGLFISIMTTFIILPLALSMGLCAGYFGGWVDQLIQLIYTVINSIPSVLLIGASLLSWQIFQDHYFSHWTMLKQADMKILIICVLLGLTNWASLCRYVRAEIFKLREMNYIKTAQLLGSSSFLILRKHLLPNVMHVVIMSLILEFSYFILAESVLTYIGIGVSPITISWGNMINAARLELARIPIVWWPLVTAFGFMLTVVLVCNLLAEALRKALNPREEVLRLIK